jgi:DNA (cytosine-5)-methyltransferase 1
MERRPIAVDLFAGVGGLSLGFESAGFNVVAAVEYDPIHAATHKINFPRCAVICGDVRNVTGTDVRLAAGIGEGTVDVVFGGPPCQGFSLMGRRVLDDPRNSLVFHFLRLVAEIKPRTFVMENVPGMATGRHTDLLIELIENFKNLGYSTRSPYRILNAVNFGVPQDRRRLFLMGAKFGAKLPDYPEPITRPRSSGRRQNGNGVLDFELPLCPSAEDALGDLPNLEKYDSLFDSDEIRIKLSGGSRYAQILKGEIEDPGDYSPRRERDRFVLTGCWRTTRRCQNLGSGKRNPVPPSQSVGFSESHRMAFAIR